VATVARTVDLDEHELRVRFSGLSVLRHRRRELRVPRTAIRRISTAPFDRRDDGRRYFLSYEDPAKTITVDVDRAETRSRYDVLVIGL
jgi:hypothetical protein